MPTLDELKKRLNVVEAQIAETEARLPAHSIKPPIMQLLLSLEDERDALIQRIKAIAEDGDDAC